MTTLSAYNPQTGLFAEDPTGTNPNTPGLTGEDLLQWMADQRAAALPIGAGGLLGATSSAGTATPIALTARFTISAGSLDLAPNGATTGQALVYNGTAWAPATITGGGTPYTLPAATSGALGGVKPGAGVTIAQDGTISTTASPVSALPALATVVGTQILPTSDSSGNLTAMTLAQHLAWELANDGSQDLTQAPVQSTLPAGNVMFLTSAGAVVLVPASLLGSGGITPTPTPTAPSQVGSLTAGTPTSTTIPVTYTAATGTAPITYAGQTSPHGAGTWTANGGTFGATGGTFTGLTASTAYDLRIIATNSTGSSTTTLTNVSDAAAGGGGGAPANHVALTQTNQTFVARADGSGKQMQVAGYGTAPVTLPSNGQWLIKIGVRGGTSFNYANGANSFIKIGNTNGSNYVDASLNNRSITPGDNVGGHADPQPASMTDGAIHEVALEAHTGGGSTAYQDGVATLSRSSSVSQGGASVLTYYADINPSIVSGVFDIRIYDGTVAAPGNLLYEWLLDGNGMSL